MMTYNCILNQLSSIQNKRERLCLLVNYHSKLLFNTLKLSEVQFINIGQHLSEKLMMLPKQERSVLTSLFFNEIIRSSSFEVVGLDRLEVLFNRELAIDPLKLLRENAKEKTIIALWPGQFDPKIGLSYAQPSHSEYRFYKPQEISDLLIVDIEAYAF